VRSPWSLAPACSVLGALNAAGAAELGPATIPCFGLYEASVEVNPALTGNPFTDVEVQAVFTPDGGAPIEVEGFCDESAGRVFRVRFCPAIAGTRYTFALTTNALPGQTFSGSFRTTAPEGMEPVIVDPEHPKHFVSAGSGRPFHHLGLTAYHLLDPSHTDADIEAVLDYCVQHGFNKVRFLLTGYPRDNDTRVPGHPSYRPAEQWTTGDPWRLPNYGAPPGGLSPLPAWLGEAQAYDFTRPNVAYWQRVDRAVAAMRERGIVATCIFTIEKQDLPMEYGALTDAELLLYRYAVARLAAYSNVWWDLGNEHNEYRSPEWAAEMGARVKAWDPYDRLCSAHAYAEWVYGDQPWADFIVAQQYGTPAEVNAWALKYAEIPKPYVNEEYGYEGGRDEPGHGMNADWVRRCHWAIALAGGHATYGDWSAGTPFYTGTVGAGQAPAQLRHLREVLEAITFATMTPNNALVGENALCLASAGEAYLVYLPDGGETTLRLRPAAGGYVLTWIDPRTGDRAASRTVQGESVALTAPGAGDWTALLVAR